MLWQKEEANPTRDNETLIFTQQLSTSARGTTFYEALENFLPQKCFINFALGLTITFVFFCMEITENNNNEHLNHIIFTLFLCVTFYSFTIFYTSPVGVYKLQRCWGFIVFQHICFNEDEFFNNFFMPIKLKWNFEQLKYLNCFQSLMENCNLLSNLLTCSHLESSDIENDELLLHAVRKPHLTTFPSPLMCSWTKRKKIGFQWISKQWAFFF